MQRRASNVIRQPLRISQDSSAFHSPESNALKPKKLFQIGSYLLDTNKAQLLRDGEPVLLAPKAFELLTVLASRAGEVVSKNELMEALWPDSYVEEANLAQNVFLLRKALGETAHDRNYVMTVPGKGYRLAAEVRELTNGNATEQLTVVADEPPLAAETLPLGQAPASPRNWLRIAAACTMLALLAFIGWRLLQERRPAPPHRIVLAVLPFMNLTGDARQDYFSDGFTEEMIAQLGRLEPEHLGVIARTSVMRYKNEQDQLQKIARELRADYVLEGSVRRDSGNVRITAQLIQTKDQTHIWARQYDRQLTSLLVVQGEIAQEIADEIQLTLGKNKLPGPAQQVVLSPKTYQAYDLYLKGRYFWNKRTPEGFRQAAEYFQQAIAEDPKYARSYAGLADTYSLMSTWFQVPQNRFMPQAEAAAVKALEIDPTLAEAHTSLALIAERYHYDRQTAEKEYRRAIELDPAYPVAHQWYAEFLALQGRFSEALNESERARQLDPLSLIIATDRAAILYYARQYDRAIEQFSAVLEMDPTFGRAYMVIDAEVQQRKFTQAMTDLERLHRNFHSSPYYWATRAYVDGFSGQAAEAKRI